ncbi:MAG: glycosyl hydrolase family 65 protein [Clostridiales bacterium]|nr:glycosyl hydrolase family 65 protein [Clostridiales bacterium]
MQKLVGRSPRKKYWKETSNPTLEARLSTQFSLANGYIGLRGTHEEMPSWASPGFFIAGAFCPAPAELVPIFPDDAVLSHPERIKPEYHKQYKNIKISTVVNLPNPVSVKLKVGEELISLDSVSIATCERILHMDEARVSRRLVIRDSKWRRTIIDSERFVSWANRQLICFRYEVKADGHDAPLSVEPYINIAVTNERNIKLYTVINEYKEPGVNRITVQLPDYDNNITISQVYEIKNTGKVLVLDVAIGISEDSCCDADKVATEALHKGLDFMREEHIKEVEKAYNRSNVIIDADAYTEQGFRFGIMHLEAAFPCDNPRTSLGVKGITGEGYKFVILWDAEFHMFPYFLFTNPGQAKVLIQYRYNLLDAARENARKWGYKGAQYPWEAGRTGKEEGVPWLVLTDRELHISADIAYAVKLYNDITGDSSVLINYGAEIVFETARFFTSRVTFNKDENRYELRDIGCPDQYHTIADNNVFINRMAKWNLEYAAALAKDERLVDILKRINLTDSEVAGFAEIVDKMYIIKPNEDGIIEEFEGYFKLSSDMRGIGERFCSHTQAVKQADVVLLFQPFTDEYSKEIQQKNWYFYDARTFHGSSLSLPGMALAAAGAGLLDESVDNFTRSARMDLDDVNLSTDLGVHLAGYAVLWETVVFGFGGLCAGRDVLNFRPRVPRQWDKLSFNLNWHDCKFNVEVRHGLIRFTADDKNPGNVVVRVWDGEIAELEPGKEYVFEFSEERVTTL